MRRVPLLSGAVILLKLETNHRAVECMNVKGLEVALFHLEIFKFKAPYNFNSLSSK